MGNQRRTVPIMSSINSNTIMQKKISSLATERVPVLSSRITLFQSKLRIARYAPGTVTDYCHAIYKAVAHVGKLPEEFTQEDADGYLQFLLDRKPQPAVSQFKHFIYGLKCYLNTLGYPELQGLVLPKIRREKKLPHIMSKEQVMTLLRNSDLYFKALFGVIYDCGLRSSEACNLCWNDIYQDRLQVHIKYAKGGKDRIVPISSKMLTVLNAYRKEYPSNDFVFKGFGKYAGNGIKTSFILKYLKEHLKRLELDHTLTTHALRHSYATHLLDAGEDIQTVQQRLGHRSVVTTMVYLHLAKVQKHECVYLIDHIFS